MRACKKIEIDDARGKRRKGGFLAKLSLTSKAFFAVAANTLLLTSFMVQ